jgi:hypothetical protein
LILESDHEAVSRVAESARYDCNGDGKNSVAARELVEALNDAQSNWQPAPKKWSIAQCLEHLTVSTAGFDQYFTRAIAAAHDKRPADNALPYRPSLMGGWLIRQLLPESVRKVPAPKIFRPASSSIEGALPTFGATGEFLEFVRATRVSTTTKLGCDRR